jgi:hypothetical protein
MPNVSAIELEAVYVLPVSLAVQSALFGREYEVNVAGLDGVILLPRVAWSDDDQPSLVAPSIDSLTDEERRSWIEQLGFRPWGYPASWNSATRSVDHGTVDMIVFRFTNFVDDSLIYSNFDSKGRGRPHSDVLDTLFSCVGGWFDALRTWVAVLTQQDTDIGGGPLRSEMTRGRGLAAWTVDGSTISRPAHSNVTDVVLRQTAPMAASTFELVLRLVARDASPPAEHLLLVSARAALNRGEHRHAVIEAATATELALNRLFDTALRRLARSSREALLGEPRTLGRLAPLVGRMGIALPDNIVNNVVTPRNAVMHHNAVVSRVVASNAIDTAAEVVLLVEPLPTSG